MTFGMGYATNSACIPALVGKVWLHVCQVSSHMCVGIPSSVDLKQAADWRPSSSWAFSIPISVCETSGEVSSNLNNCSTQPNLSLQWASSSSTASSRPQ